MDLFSNHKLLRKDFNWLRGKIVGEMIFELFSVMTLDYVLDKGTKTFINIQQFSLTTHSYFV